MMRRLSAWLAALLAAGAVHAADPVAADAAAQQEALYASAMRALAEGRPDDATEMLMRFLEKEPQHAGAWLDLAISQCELGHGKEAERLFTQVELRFAPPPGIVEVIQTYRKQGCQAPPAKGRQWSIAAGRGYDTNVNQGATNPYFSTGSGDALLNWELAPEFLPKPDHYTALSADYSQPLGVFDTWGFVQLRARRYDKVSTQNTNSLLFGLDRPWTWGDWKGKAMAVLGLVQLDGHFYQRQTQLQMRATPPLKLPEGVNWTLTAGLSHLKYPTRTRYDSNTLDLGNSLDYRGSSSQSSASLGLLSDRGQTGRLGGSRQGWYATLLTYQRLGPYLDGQLDWSRQVWRSSSVYSPNVIDIARHQDTQQLHASLSWPVTRNQTLQLEWRAVRNNENISLFQYNSRMVQLNWRWDNY